MGLFTPKISDAQMRFVKMTLNQLHDSGNLVNTTVKPDVFFKRLHFTLDLLLRLQMYEKYKIFKHGGGPTKDYKRIVSNLEATVDDFINRSLAANQAKIATLKTERARRNNYENYVIALISAFDCAHTFWEGDRGFPHYTGPLFTENNYNRVQAMYYALDDEP